MLLKERARRLKQKRKISKTIKEDHLRKLDAWDRNSWCPKYEIYVSKGACLNRYFITKLKFCVRCKITEVYFDELEKVIKGER